MGSPCRPAGLLSGTATAERHVSITIDATNFVGPMATQAFTLTVQPPAAGPTIQLRSSTLLVGNYNEKVSGNGWDKDSTRDHLRVCLRLVRDFVV